MVVEVNILDLETPEYAMEMRAEFVVKIRIWAQELMIYQWEVIETVDCQLCCRVRLKHYYSCCTLFLYYRNHPTHNLESILETHRRENEHRSVTPSPCRRDIGRNVINRVISIELSILLKKSKGKYFFKYVYLSIF